MDTHIGLVKNQRANSGHKRIRRSKSVCLKLKSKAIRLHKSGYRKSEIGKILWVSHSTIGGWIVNISRLDTRQNRRWPKGTSNIRAPKITEHSKFKLMEVSSKVELSKEVSVLGEYLERGQDRVSIYSPNGFRLEVSGKASSITRHMATIGNSILETVLHICYLYISGICFKDSPRLQLIG